MTRRIVVFGVSAFSRMVCSLLTNESSIVVARTAHERFIPETTSADLPFVPFEALIDQYPPGEHEIFVALEHARQNAARAELADCAKRQGYRLTSFVSPSAILDANVSVGEHTLILDGVIAQYGVQIGANAIIGAKCFFGQQVLIGANTYFGPSVFVDRFASIGGHCALGSGVRIAESVVVPDWTHLRPFEELRQSPTHPTLVHAALRAPGIVVDRRDG